MANKHTSRIAFRVDASLEIGTGHVMRCLTLANVLRKGGAECYFICREHSGHLIDLIIEHGFFVYRLAMLADISENYVSKQKDSLSHARWLGVPWEVDVDVCKEHIKTLSPNWLVVDHYALDARWEAAACPPNTKLLVIDDLADREHLADVLLDQNLGRKANDYKSLVPECCRCFIGTEFALLRTEFVQWRNTSLSRRRHQTRLKRLLIALGGVDKDNLTGRVLEALKDSNLPNDCEINVIMGGTAPWLGDVEIRAKKLPWPTEVAVNVNDMARRMAEADLAIGAAGSSSWERCCLGLPTIMLVLADNQWSIAQALNEYGAAVFLNSVNSTNLSWNFDNLVDSDSLWQMSMAAASLTSGKGAELLSHELLR